MFSLIECMDEEMNCMGLDPHLKYLGFIIALK